MKRLIAAVWLFLFWAIAQAVDLSAGQSATIDLAPGKKLTITTAAASTALVQRYDGPTSIDKTAIPASTAQVYGEYFIRQQFRIYALTGSLTYSDAQSTDTVRTGTSVSTGGTIDGTVIGGTTPAAATVTALTASSVTDSGLTSGRVPFASTGGLLTDASTLTFSAGTLTATTFAGALSGNASTATTAGTVTTAAQPAITSVGTLTGLTVGTAVIPTSGTIATVLTGVSASIGGGALLAGACASDTVTITGAASGMAVTVTPVTDPGAAIYWHGFVSASDTVTVKVCAAIGATPTATTYQVRVWP